jgi:hypothetical protein
MLRVRRFDIGSVRKPQKLENGWLRADAHLTRTGVLEYRNPDGSVRRELRLPEEVFHADALGSFAMVPLTNGHPPEGLLTAENTGRYQVGSIGEQVVPDGSLVRSSVLVTDAATVKKIEDGTVGLSMGYLCDLEEAPGEWNGQRYDGIQRKIRGNHVALVPNPRAGDVARVHMDSHDAAMIASESESGSAHKDRKMALKKIRIDSVEVEVEETAAQLIEKSAGGARRCTEVAPRTAHRGRPGADRPR